jgi:hypothetical protein
MARATLLLRLASAFTFKALDSAGKNLNEAEFWWTKKATELGLSAAPGGLNSFLDLWDDVQVQLEAFEDWKANVGRPVSTMTMMAVSRPLIGLSQLQRAGLWLLGG